MTRARDLASGSGIEAGEVLPHIIPGVLYPSYVASGTSNKLLDGTTSHGSNGNTAFGTEQADGRKYYYTNIAGSKPIKDPRIGGHFGSQRHKFRSIQLLEQETATQGVNSYSVDGREWIRMSGTATTDIEIKNHGSGNMIKLGNGTDFFEITGYFNDINIRLETHPNYDGWTKQLNGATASAGQSAVTADSPLTNRYVDSGSVLNVGVGATLGINTVRINSHDNNIYVFGCELIAQDTSSDANKVKIQIPSQNVVSYGKKFTVSGTPHYDPFNGFTNDTTLFSSVVDTATSLGLGTATTWGAPWDKGSNDHIRPFNGGRVVKWVDSSGTIKTSVTMMPANAQNVGPTASNEITTASATNSHTISFSDDAIDHSLSEIAKTFWWREFGNGAANQGGPNTSNYADATMLHLTADPIAYVMDDGLTSLAGENAIKTTGTGVPNYSDDALMSNDNNKGVYITFIGTGVSIRSAGNDGQGVYNIAQNLPYGTHILKVQRISGNDPQYIIDGFSLGTITHGNLGNFAEVTFHQPKKPPIPEDAVVLADYMLMADHVVQTSVNNDEISKGVRLCSGSRDHFTDSSGSITSVETRPDLQMFGLSGHMSNASHSSTTKLPFFGTNAQCWVQGAGDVSHTITIGGVGKTEINHNHTSGDSARDGITIADSEKVTLGMTDITTTIPSGDAKRFWATAVATPIHTSSHYQTFETPFLHELVGGDRNMEQHNLIVTPDGKSWDEVTRDVSYLSTNHKITVMEDSDHAAGDIVFSCWRGSIDSNVDMYFQGLMNKDFAIGYDRMICLVNGTYYMQWNVHASSHAAIGAYVLVNDITAALAWVDDVSERSGATAACTVQLKRGDYVQCQANSTNIEGNGAYNIFNIIKLA